MLKTATRNPETILALDVGERRIGVARARLDVRIAQPFTTLENPEQFVPDIQKLVESEKAAALVIGLPRGLAGQETAQTAAVQKFAEGLEPHVAVPLYFTDEAATSVGAEAELKRRGKPYSKGDVDALAATYILEDYLANNHDICTEGDRQETEA